MAAGSPRSIGPGVELVRLEAAGERVRGEVRVHEGSPLFDGHFPDLPVLPGVGQIALVLALWRRARGPLTVEEVVRVKFLQAVPPGSTLIIDAVSVPGAAPRGDAAGIVRVRWQVRRTEGDGAEVEVSRGELLARARPGVAAEG